MKHKLTFILFCLIWTISLFSKQDSLGLQDVFTKDSLALSEDSHELKVLAFNVWNEGTSVENGMEKIKDIIVEMNPDIVAFSEVRNFNGENWTMKMVIELMTKGLYYNMAISGTDISILSKFPITKAGQIVANDIARFDIDVNGINVIVCPIHLDHQYYTAYLPRGYNCVSNWGLLEDERGNPKLQTNVDTILSYNLNSRRDESIGTLLKEMETEKSPIILLGDFNEPSHLDWTEKTKDLFDHHNTVVPWPISTNLYQAGYVDAFRQVYPDELKNPGFSWPSYAHGIGSTSHAHLADERERIDFIYYKGNDVEVKKIALVGPKESYEKNELSTTYTEHENFMGSHLKWPSDHKAIYAELKIKF